MMNDILTCDLSTLVEKYSSSIPRYTSYPTAVEFSEDVDAKRWEQLLTEDRPESATASLYVHIPFCESLCYFCACNKKIVKDDREVAPYLSAIAAELNRYQEHLRPVPALQQLHWGGGTPNFLSGDATEELFAMLTEVFPEFSTNADISVEIDPRTVDYAKLERYKKLGFTRISAGVQDFTPAVQEAINRVQPYEKTSEVCESIRALGFSGLNLDLIYGLPMQTANSFGDTIDKVLELNPDRIALYGYAHVTWKKKVQRSLERHMLPSPEQRLSLFVYAIKRLIEADYVYVGMDHFARRTDTLARAMEDGTLNRNFMGYSTHRGSRVYGVGVSAVSSLPQAYAQNAADLDTYRHACERGAFATSRGVELSVEDRLRATVIEDVLCRGVIDYETISRSWGVEFQSHFQNELLAAKDLERDGLLRLEPTQLVVSTIGRLFLRNIAALFDTYLGQYSQSSTPRFSQSV